MPDVITIPLTPAQFVKAKTALGPDLIGDDRSGTAGTPQLSFTYLYDGATLTMIITAKHGLAKFASDSAIKSHILELLS